MAEFFDEMGWQSPRDGEAPYNVRYMARLLRDYSMFLALARPGDHVMGAPPTRLPPHTGLPPPASRRVVENLPDEQITSLGLQCPICLKEHDEGDKAKKLPCDHIYHTDCILTWLAKTNSCPLCRLELPTDDENYEAYRKEKM